MNISGRKIMISMSEEEFELLYEIFDLGRMSFNVNKQMIRKHFGNTYDVRMLDEKANVIWDMSTKLYNHRKTSMGDKESGNND